MFTTSTSTIGTTSSTTSTITTPTTKPWIRGVNIGGWLVLERYIVPYQFAITDCHVRGELCWYPGALSAPTNMTDDEVCDINRCHPVVPHYPIDEWTLGQAFLQPHSNSTKSSSVIRTKQGIDIAERWLNSHLEHFVTEHDMIAMKNAGVTHIRVPLPHFMLGDVTDSEPWIVGKRWYYFCRMCAWARQYHIQVWPDLHTAAGSQNGFDNSGQQNVDWSTCTGWSNWPQNIDRTLRNIDSITKQMVLDNISDVITGFGLLNEPFKDCNRTRYYEFLEIGKQIVRTNLGEHLSIYVSDTFTADKFNDGKFWLHGSNNNSIHPLTPHPMNEDQEDEDDEENLFYNNNPYHDTYLDSHYYQVFDANMRNLSPKQHVAFTCQYQYYDAVSCCYEKDYSIWSWLTGQYGKKNIAIPANGIRRIFGEWSAAYNILTNTKLDDIMNSIAMNGTAIEYDRILSHEEKQFLLSYVQAQMVVLESQQVGVSSGWFFWTMKVEGNAFAEWNFLLGIEQGWIPIIPPPDISSESLYGSCYDILLRIPRNDTVGLRDNYPDPKKVKTWSGVIIDDDVVVTHGESLIDKQGHHPKYPRSPLIHHNPLFRMFHRDDDDNKMYYYGRPHYHTIMIETIVILGCLLLLLLLRKRKSWFWHHFSFHHRGVNDDTNKNRSSYPYSEITNNARIIDNATN